MIKATSKNIIPSIVGLGYVGLPIYIRLNKKFNTLGYDVSRDRVNQLNLGIDINNEFVKKEILFNSRAKISSNINNLKNSNFYILCVPTPIKKNNVPDLKPLINAIKIITKVIKKGDIIFLESTVYPGVTEDICLKIIEKKTKLKNNVDFFIGYSPERINPGDKKHSVEKIKKIVAINTNNKNVLHKVKKIYTTITSSIILSKKIKEAEAAKVIENIQRDLNIGLFNEIFKLCRKSKLNYSKVISLASTKWNFHKYNFGLVGGHCLPVDPYYLSFFARQNKIKLNIVLAGRKTNNSMSKYFINLIKEELKKKLINYRKDKIIFYGVTYKKNVPDIRNSLSIKIINYFNKINKNIFVKDPNIRNNIYKKLNYKKIKKTNKVSCAIILVKHDDFKKDKFIHSLPTIDLFKN